MSRGLKISALTTAAFAALCLAQPAMAGVVTTYVDISSFANNNIFTDLNQNYPNTGPGTPGSHTGTANSTFLFTPGSYTPPAGTSAASPFYTVTTKTVVNDGPSNGISFQLKSNANGQDFVQIGTSGPTGYTGPNPITVPIGINDVTTVYALMSAYIGQSFTATFTGADSSTEVFSSIFLPDFNGGSGGSLPACTSSPPAAGAACEQAAYVVNDVGGGGTGNSTNGSTNNYDLTEVEFSLNGTLSNEVLTSMSFNSAGYETLLFGITTQSVSSTTSVPEPLTLSLFSAGLAGAIAMRRRKAKT